MNKISRLSAYHEGNQPIRVLQHNIIYQFESTNPTFLELSKEIITKKGLEPGISYNINDLPLIDHANRIYQTPFVGSNKKIEIHEAFLSYVWCISYSLIVLYDETVAKPSQNRVAQNLNYQINDDKIQKAFDLFDYALNLINKFESWDTDKLPNPEIYYSEETFWIEKANGIFVYAINFILCHEFAHIEKEHIDDLIRGKNTNTHILCFEKEADKRAIELMLLGVTPETKITAHLGILIGFCCLLFLNSKTTSENHPDTDNRINDFLETVNPDPSNGLWGIAYLALVLWDKQYSNQLIIPNEVHDLKELYYNIKKQIDDKKVNP